MHKLLGHIPFLSKLGERFVDLLARPKQFNRSEFAFAGKCADSVATCVSMHPYKSMTNICAHWSCNFGNVNDSFPFFGATFLEQFWFIFNMKRQRYDEYAVSSELIMTAGYPVCAAWAAWKKSQPSASSCILCSWSTFWCPSMVFSCYK